jgi:hypothetical protein
MTSLNIKLSNNAHKTLFFQFIACKTKDVLGKSLGGTWGSRGGIALTHSWP